DRCASPGGKRVDQVSETPEQNDPDDQRPRPQGVTRKELFDRLAALGIETSTQEHEAAFTVAESARLGREVHGGHAKSSFLTEQKRQLSLGVAASGARIDLKPLPKRIGAGGLSFGSPERLGEVLGVAPGSVTPFALINDRARRVTVILDA